MPKVSGKGLRGSNASLAIGGRRGGAVIGAFAALSAFCAISSQVLLERALGVQGFAEWAYLTSVLAILVPLACMGSGHLLLSSALGSDLAGRDGVRLLSIYFGSFTAAAVAAFISAIKLGAPGNLATLPWSLLLGVFLVQLPVVLVFPIFQRHNRTSWVALWPLLQTGSRLVVAIAAIFAGLSIFGVLAFWAFLSLGLATVAIYQSWPVVRSRFAQRDYTRTSFQSLRERFARLCSAGVGFGTNDILDSLDLKLIVPLAAFFFGATETAAAGLVAILLSAVQFFPYVLVMRVLLPAVHRGSNAIDESLRLLVLRLSAFAALVLLPVAATFLWIGFPVLALVVNGDYSSQEMVFSWLGICFIPLCVSQLAAAPHMARRGTWRLFRWRAEALGLFVLGAFAFEDLGLFAIVVGFSLGRIWLCIRVLLALRP